MTKIVGILNVTPNSFSGDGILDVSQALARAKEMINEGADIIDIGGEATNPGAEPVSLEEELHRVLPVIEAVMSYCSSTVSIMLSIDTTKSEVAKEGCKLGVKIINDISGGEFDSKIWEVAREYKVRYIIGHITARPKFMQSNLTKEPILETLKEYFEKKIKKAKEFGLSPDKLIIDPCVGFGKSAKQNWKILQNLNVFKQFGLPLMIGLSRKTFIGKLLGSEENPAPPSERENATSLLNFYCMLQGVDLIRTHNVKNAREARKTCKRLTQG
ncbi:MAG: dihydropteroate synthase [Candidatus Portnoybacteria bacterium]|nr:dihydropteroate synthase [Candidatus Portnoybacteria bacterium]